MAQPFGHLYRMQRVKPKNVDSVVAWFHLSTPLAIALPDALTTVFDNVGDARIFPDNNDGIPTHITGLSKDEFAALSVHLEMSLMRLVNRLFAIRRNKVIWEVGADRSDNTACIAAMASGLIPYSDSEIGFSALNMAKKYGYNIRQGREK